MTCASCARPAKVRGWCRRCYDRDRYGYYDRARGTPVLRVVVRPVGPLRAGEERGPLLLRTEGGVTTAWEVVAK